MNRRNFSGALGVTLATTFTANAFNIPLSVINLLNSSARADNNDFLPPDENGISVRKGFNARVVARTGEIVGSSNYAWHVAPDGGAIIPDKNDGGYYYVSNSEAREYGEGGVGSIKFDKHGEIVDAYPILTGTYMNCAGGVSPEGKWFSCEEYDFSKNYGTGGGVWMTDPTGNETPIRLDALGTFKHEAVAIDPKTGIVYMTEDSKTGLFYRFVPEQKGQYFKGTLQAAYIRGRYTDEDGKTLPDYPYGSVTWLDVPDPQAASGVFTRDQDYILKKKSGSRSVKGTPFRGGEGAIIHNGQIFFSTKHDNKIWKYNISGNKMELYWQGTSPHQVDNLALTPSENLAIAEDNQSREYSKLSVYNGKETMDLVRVYHHSAALNQASELAGPNFVAIPTVSGGVENRLYFSSQRGQPNRELSNVDYQLGKGGMTIEVTGPFLEHNF